MIPCVAFASTGDGGGGGNNDDDDAGDDANDADDDSGDDDADNGDDMLSLFVPLSVSSIALLRSATQLLHTASCTPFPGATVVGSKLWSVA